MGKLAMIKSVDRKVVPAGRPVGRADAEGPVAWRSLEAGPRLSVATAIATAAHLVVLVIFQYGMPQLFTSPPVNEIIIPVELVTIDEITTAPKPTADEAIDEPEPAPPPPTPPQMAAAPPELEAVPLPPEPDAKPAPKPKPPKAAAKPEPQPKTARARPDRKPKAPDRRDFASVLKSLETQEPKPREKTEEGKKPVEEAPRAPQTAAAEMATATEIDALRAIIRRQIEPCWNPPVGAAMAEDLVVRIHVSVDPDGTVRQARILDSGRMVFDRFYEAAADSARRAVLNPRCNPLQLPQDRYDLWQELVLTFNPMEMIGL